MNAIEHLTDKASRIHGQYGLTLAELKNLNPEAYNFAIGYSHGKANDMLGYGVFTSEGNKLIAASIKAAPITPWMASVAYLAGMTSYSLAAIKYGMGQAKELSQTYWLSQAERVITGAGPQRGLDAGYALGVWASQAERLAPTDIRFKNWRKTVLGIFEKRDAVTTALVI